MSKTKFEQLSDGSYTMDQSSYLNQKLETFANYIGSGKASSPLPSNYHYLGRVFVR
jgi:hypothetical protein